MMLAIVSTQSSPGLIAYDAEVSRGIEAFADFAGWHTTCSLLADLERPPGTRSGAEERV
jgi:hypothetical protein